jgi:hypothetical protein
VVLVWAGALTADGNERGRDVGIAVALAILLVTPFRIVDDLVERHADSRRHPDRLPGAAGSAAPFVVTAIASWSTAAVLILDHAGMVAAGLFAGFTALMTVWYGWRGSRSAARDRVLLLKYPVFSAVIAGDAAIRTMRGALALVVVYLCSCTYEWAHDPESPATPVERSIHAVLLASACIALVFSLGGSR